MKPECFIPVAANHIPAVCGASPTTVAVPVRACGHLDRHAFLDVCDEHLDLPAERATACPVCGAVSPIRHKAYVG